MSEPVASPAAAAKPLPRIVFFSILTIFAATANALSIEFLPGSYFSFGMGAILCIAARLGIIPGIGALAIARFMDLSPIRNPFPALILGIEVAFIGGLRRRRPRASLLALDAVFWPLLGLPLFFLSYRAILGISGEITAITMLKAWLAGLFNAQLAGLVANSRILDRFLGAASSARPSFGGFLKSRMSAVMLPVAILALWAVVASIRGEVEDRLRASLRAGVERAGSVDAATDDSVGVDTVIDSLNHDPFDPVGRYGKIADLESGRLSRLVSWGSEDLRIEPGAGQHPTEVWRSSRFYAFARLRGYDIWYSVSFEPFFQSVYKSYALALAMALAALYGTYGLLELVARSLERRTAKLIDAASRLSETIESGEEPVWPESDIEELAILTNAFRDDAKRLRKAFAELTASRDRLESAVRDRTQELETRSEEIRRLLARAEGERESERIRVARELHDEFGQGLSGLGMALHVLERRLGPVEALGKEKIEDMRMALAELMAGMRRMIANLRPEALDRIGLPEALAHFAADRSSNDTEGPSVIFSCSVSDGFSPSEETRTAVYRIAQEATVNAIRHSGSREVRMALKEDRGWLVLEVADSGAGFSPEDSAGGPERHCFGIMGMRERCLALGGMFMIDSVPGKGTVVNARFPYGQEERPCAR